MVIFSRMLPTQWFDNHTAACEQSSTGPNKGSNNKDKIDKTNYDNKTNMENYDNSEHFKQKLLFTSETEPKDVPDIKKVHQPDKKDNMVNVADDEPAIQVLTSDSMNQEYYETLVTNLQLT